MAVDTNKSDIAGALDTLTADKELILAKKPVYDFFKRVFDLTASFLGLVILSPFFLILSVIIIIDDPGNPFYVQKRTGKNGKVFSMFKFRSMIKNAEQKRGELLSQNEADGPIFKLTDDPRVTKIGRFIRKTSIDELPQLLNVLIGNMSLVGPRPLPTYEQEQCDDFQQNRLLVKPGLTCYWQISGRSDISFDEFIRLDIKYINERSALTDLKILFSTVAVVFKGKGAY